MGGCRGVSSHLVKKERNLLYARSRSGEYPNLFTDLLAWYRADGTDRSGNGNTLASTSLSSSLVTGIGGVASAAMLPLPGNPGRCYFRNANIIPANSDFSMMGWMQYRDDASLFISFPISQSSAAGTDWLAPQIGVGQPFDIQGVYSTVNGTDFIGTDQGGGVISNGQWCQALLTYQYSTGTFKFFVNGIFIDVLTGITADYTGGAFQIGSQFSNDGGFEVPHQFMGVWSYVLSNGGVTTPGATAGGDVATLWNSGNGYDPTA